MKTKTVYCIITQGNRLYFLRRTGNTPATTSTYSTLYDLSTKSPEALKALSELLAGMNGGSVIPQYGCAFHYPRSTNGTHKAVVVRDDGS